MNHKFQDVWALKMRWVKPIFNEARLVTFMKYCVYSKIEKKDKVLVVKWDSIEKHASKKKTHDGKWLWIQNVGKQKIKLLMLNYQQQLSSNNLILVKQWKIKGDLFTLLLFSVS